MWRKEIERGGTAFSRRLHGHPEGSLQGTGWAAKEPKYLQVDSKESDQPGHICRLI